MGDNTAPYIRDLKDLRVKQIGTDDEGRPYYALAVYDVNSGGAGVITGTFNGSVIISAGPTGTSALQVQGNVAHDAVDAGNPVKVGAKAYAPDSGPADVASGDRADLFSDLKGRLLVYLATKLDPTNDVIAIGKGPLGAPNYVTGQVTATPTAATLVAARATRRALLIKNVSGGSIIYVGPPTVTTSNGFQLLAGESVVFNITGLVQVISSGTNSLVFYQEEYD